MKQLLLILLCLTATLRVAAQQQDETVYRLELGVGGGAAFQHNDLKSKLSAAGAVIARFPLNPRMALKGQFTYAGLKGSTDGIKAFYPANPDASGTARLSYSADNAVYSLAGLYEVNFFPYGYEQDYRGHKRLTPYIQLGFGLTYGPAGKGFSPDIPLGAGVKYKIGPRLNLGLDYLVHFTLSDKLDGLEAPLGIKSSGFRNKDHYSALTLTLTYDLRPKCPTCNRAE